MDIILIPLYNLIDALLWMYVWILIFSVVMSWLLAFGIVNTNNPFIEKLSEFLYRATEPVLRPIRKVVPSFGGLDISPILLILAIYFIRDLMGRLVIRFVLSNVVGHA